MIMFFAVFFIILIVYLFLYLDTVKPKNFPPGPKWIPLFGNLFEVRKYRKKTGYLYKALLKLSMQYDKDESLLGLKIGKNKIVIVNNMEANKEMLLNEDIDGRPAGVFYQIRGKKLGILFSDGELWKEQRRFILRHLKDFGFGKKGMVDISQSEAAYIINDVYAIIQENNNKSPIIQMHNFFSTYILNTLWTMIAGKRYEANDAQIKYLQHLMFEVLSSMDMIGSVFSQFPVLAYIAPMRSGYKKFLGMYESVCNFLIQEVAIHKEQFDINKEDNNFIDAYLRVFQQHGKINTHLEEQLVGNCLDLFIAGSETTTKSMSFCFSYLVRYQDVQKKAQEEIDRVIGRHRMPSIDDRNNMPYCEAIVHETIRHFVGRSLSLPHEAIRDTTLAGYHIPKKTVVLNNFSKFLMNERFFPDPYSFRPENFLKAGKVSLPDSYFPFGLAKRRCMGEALAKCNIFVFTTTMLQRFNFLPAPGEPLPSLDHVDGATPSAAPFKALVVPRTFNDLN